MESCGGAHYWGRELRKLGHEVRMMALQFVVPYRNDAEAICEAAGRPQMRFIPIKDDEQQAILTVHRTRALLVGERSALVNQIRGFQTEFGIVLPQGRSQIRAQLPALLDEEEMTLPHLLRSVLADQYQSLCELDHVIEGYDNQIESLARTDERAKRLMKVEGIRPLIATALIGAGSTTMILGRKSKAWSNNKAW
jgi:transposase